MDGMEPRCSQQGNWRRHAGTSRTLNWVGERWFEKIGSAPTWARCLIIFMQREHRQTWLGGVEWESQAGTVKFTPTFEDAVPIGMDDRHSRLGENNLAAYVGKWPQADEGMGEGGHHMALHRCRRKRWGRCEGCAGNRPLREAVCDTDADGRCRVIKI